MATKKSGSIGCIGKCTSGLTVKELDQITDNIHQTLIHPKGRNVFREYLNLASRRDDLACLDLYENCSEFIDKEENYLKEVKKPTLDFLKADVETAMSMAGDLGVAEIDLALMRQFKEALNGESREALFAILHDTKLRVMDHLRNAHRGFRIYAMQPCPKTK